MSPPIPPFSTSSSRNSHSLRTLKISHHLSRASPAPPDLKRGSRAKPTSPPTLPLKPSYSQIVKTKIQACDPGATARAPAMKGSRYREVPGSIPTKDNYLARDPGNPSHVSSRDPLLASAPRDQSHDLT